MKTFDVPNIFSYRFQTFLPRKTFWKFRQLKLFCRQNLRAFELFSLVNFCENFQDLKYFPPQTRRDETSLHDEIISRKIYKVSAVQTSPVKKVSGSFANLDFSSTNFQTRLSGCKISLALVPE